MRWADRLIASCTSWDDFWERARKLSTTEKGIAERLTHLYRQTAPEYRTKLQNVLISEWENNTRKLWLKTADPQ